MANHAGERMKMRKESYERAMGSVLHPYLLYRVGNSPKCTEGHKDRDGLLLPKADSWWKNNFLQNNDPDCNCYITAVSEDRKKQYEAEGIPTAPRIDGTGGGNIAVKIVAPV